MQRKLTVSQLNNYISGVFADERVLHDVIVCGEIFECKKSGPRSFITLKEGDCSLSVVSFLPVTGLEEGMSVEAKGTVSFYAKSGKLSFIADEINPTGEGKLLLELIKLRKRLQEEGLFANRPPLPTKINKIAVITSATGAVIHDIISVVKNKNPYMDICVCPTKVQGEGSAQSIAEAIKNVNKTLIADVIIIARGGGSAEDLQAYNTEIVARAVSGSLLPIISAVGHETDYTLCDLCASARAGTPSIAADMVCEDVFEKIARIKMLAKNIVESAFNKYEDRKSRIVYSANAVVRYGEMSLRSRSEKVKRDVAALHKTLERKLSSKNDKLSYLSAMIDKCSPYKILSQGYAKISKAGKEIAFAKELSCGDEIIIRMTDGTLKAEVK
ncbi:MAG: exodeoxyribonuclease VII large subunit [Clostridia bacterium]|nr:exodeoxyribonuclease VII large subunit [Clostridia bacterium]